MFLWELKNSIISQNLRELCVIETPKPNRKIPPTVASTSSATVLFITTHAALACRRHILTSHLGAWACRRHIISIALKSVCFLEHLWCSFGNSKTQSFQQNLRELCVIETPKPSRKIPHTVASTSSATVLFITTHAALACRRHIISIVLKSVCFLEHLWCSFGNSKTPSFQQNLRELCVIKANTNIPHIVASTSSATKSFITRCLSL